MRVNRSLWLLLALSIGLIVLAFVVVANTKVSQIVVP
jgi:hypothetical protein